MADVPTENGAHVCYATFEHESARTGEPQWFEGRASDRLGLFGRTLTLATTAS